MHTRIKYDYSGPVGISKQVFRHNGLDLRVVINVEEFYFEIVTNDGQPVVKGGNTKNVAVLKRQAKRALVKYGYEFGSETRNKGTVGINEQTTESIIN